MSVSVHLARKMMEEKTKESKKKKGKEPEKFEVDLDAYTEFVDKVTSDPSKDFNTLIARYRELHDAGCKIERLDTAASGMSAEAGEFMEIVKKLKFQGKPYDEKTKEHLQKSWVMMWYVAQAAMALGVRLDEVIYFNTFLLAARYPEGLFEVERSETARQGTSNALVLVKGSTFSKRKCSEGMLLMLELGAFDELGWEAGLSMKSAPQGVRHMKSKGMALSGLLRRAPRSATRMLLLLSKGLI